MEEGQQQTNQEEDIETLKKEGYNATNIKEGKMKF